MSNAFTSDVFTSTNPFAPINDVRQGARLDRDIVPNISNILGRMYPVLDKGFVRVIDYMGNDYSIVDAARISHGKERDDPEKDVKLISYLMENRHTSPFEMCEIKFHIRIPMDAWRQMIRHRTANVNEYSTRYSKAINDKQKTEPNKWRLQDSVNRQGSKGFIDNDKEGENIGQILSHKEHQFHVEAAELYDERLRHGVAKEQARKDLPLSTYTEAYWKIDLHNLLNFLRLRIDSHAQYEIRQYANVIADIIKIWVPFTWAAFENYQLQSISLSGEEIDVIRAIQENHESNCPDSEVELKFFLREMGFLTGKYIKTAKPTRTYKKLFSKCERLGIPLSLMKDPIDTEPANDS